MGQCNSPALRRFAALWMFFGSPASNLAGTSESVAGYNPAVWILLLLFLSFRASGQRGAESRQPTVQMHVLNVCSLAPADSRQMAGALARVPRHPKFIADFEIARGLSTEGGDYSRWVRTRHEFPPDGLFSTAQFSVTASDASWIETLVLRVREPKELVQIAISSESGKGPPAQEGPAMRIRVERSGGVSLVLARCPEADQSAQEQLFAEASNLLGVYRNLFRVRETVSAELSRPDLRLPSRKR